MAEFFSKKIANALSGQKKTKVIKAKKDERSDREKRLQVKEGRQNITADERKELNKLVASRRAASKKK